MGFCLPRGLYRDVFTSVASGPTTSWAHLPSLNSVSFPLNCVLFSQSTSFHPHHWLPFCDDLAGSAKSHKRFLSVVLFRARTFLSVCDMIGGFGIRYLASYTLPQITSWLSLITYSIS